MYIYIYIYIYIYPCAVISGLQTGSGQTGFSQKGLGTVLLNVYRIGELITNVCRCIVY